MRSRSHNLESFGSPSARQRERVWGRWNYVADLSSHTGKLVHQAKQFIGAPVPWLMLALPLVLILSRNGTEAVSWGIGFFTVLYIAIDQFGPKQEFTFYRLGTDLQLLALSFFGLLSVISSLFDANLVFADSLSWSLASLRWIFLLYLFTYALELFPGLNRIFRFTLLGATAVTVVSLGQYFQGVDWLRGLDLKPSVLDDGLRFQPLGFFDSTEALAAYLACLLPFATAYAVFRSHDEKSFWTVWWCRLLTFGILVLLILTFRPEFWKTAGVGLVGLLFFKTEFGFRRLLSILAVAVVTAFSILYVQGESSFAELIELKPVFAAEEVRADAYRKSMNELLALWEQAPLLGTQAPISTSSEAVNLYFLMLARVGLIGLVLYLVFVVSQILSTLRLYHEIPESHNQHRILVGASFCSQCAFHASGLFWGTLFEPFSLVFFVLTGAMTAYMGQHYSHGLVPDDLSL